MDRVLRPERSITSCAQYRPRGALGDRSPFPSVTKLTTGAFAPGVIVRLSDAVMHARSPQRPGPRLAACLGGPRNRARPGPAAADHGSAARRILRITEAQDFRATLNGRLIGGPSTSRPRQCATVSRAASWPHWRRDASPERCSALGPQRPSAPRAPRTPVGESFPRGQIEAPGAPCDPDFSRDFRYIAGDDLPKHESFPHA
jgi:hypothetical protein